MVSASAQRLESCPVQNFFPQRQNRHSGSFFIVAHVCVRRATLIIFDKQKIYDARKIHIPSIFSRCRKNLSVDALAIVLSQTHDASSIDFDATNERFSCEIALLQTQQVFFCFCWCNPNAVHVDSRLHCSDTSHSSWLRRAANGEEEKSEEGETR
jgi:hypothetical protein